MLEGKSARFRPNAAGHYYLEAVAGLAIEAFQY
jgi:hypothetical protein